MLSWYQQYPIYRGCHVFRLAVARPSQQLPPQHELPYWIIVHPLSKHPAQLRDLPLPVLIAGFGEPLVMHPFLIQYHRQVFVTMTDVTGHQNQHLFLDHEVVVDLIVHPVQMDTLLVIQRLMHSWNITQALAQELVSFL